LLIVGGVDVGFFSRVGSLVFKGEGVLLLTIAGQLRQQERSERSTGRKEQKIEQDA
jgi:hypothetical protein